MKAEGAAAVVDTKVVSDGSSAEDSNAGPGAGFGAGARDEDGELTQDFGYGGAGYGAAGGMQDR